MINKKVIALLLSASMAFTASVPVLADYYDDYYSKSGSYRVNFELEDGGKNYGIVYYADGTHKKEEVDVEVSENSVTKTDTVYEVNQSVNAYGSYSWNIYTPALKDNSGSKTDRVEFIWADSSTVSSDFWGNYSAFGNGQRHGELLNLRPTDEVDVDKNYVLTTEAAGYKIGFEVMPLYLDADIDYNDIEENFVVVDNGDGTYSRKAVSDNHSEWEYYEDIRTDSTTEYKFTAPEELTIPSSFGGYTFEKWIDATKVVKHLSDNLEGDLPDLKLGEETKLANLSGYGTYYGNYVAVFKEANKTNDKIVEKTVSTNAGNHTIALKMNEAPAYTGGKLRATDFISSFKIDGKEYPAKDIKIKVEGDKKVGSKVKVTIKKIKGADKQTNKDVKGTVLGEVTIRPIDVSEVTTWNKTFTKEGQIVVKTNKNGDIKSVAAVVSKKGVNSGDNKAKKLKVKKGTYTYDSAKKTITFNDGAICKGSVTIK